MEIYGDRLDCDPGLKFVHRLKRKMLADTVWDEVLRCCSDMQCQVLILYYQMEWSLLEIANLYGLTPARISQIHLKGMARVRYAIYGKKGVLFV